MIFKSEINVNMHHKSMHCVSLLDVVLPYKTLATSHFIWVTNGFQKCSGTL